MNQLIVKEVDFQGSSILSVKDIDGKVYVGVSWVCNGIGFTKAQKDAQVEKLQQDLILKRGCRKFPAGAFDAFNETLAIELDFLPLWLAKISITNKMQENNPKLVQKLIEYQLKAKDVLAKAFIEEKRSILESYMEMSEEDRAIAYFQSQKQLKIQEPKVELYDLLMEAKNAQEMNVVAKAFGTGRNKLFKLLRKNNILMHNNVPYQMYLDSGCFTVVETSRFIDNEVKNFPKTLVNPRGFELIKNVVYKNKVDLA